MSDAAVALIGYGTAGSVFHAPLITATPGLHLRAVVTQDPVRSEQVVSRYPGTQVLRSSGELFERAEDFDVVVIATPHPSHLDLARQAVSAGLRVIVDKPLALSAQDAEAFHGELLTAGLTDRVGVFQNRRWDGDFLTLAALVAAGRLGIVHRLESRFERWRPAPRAGSWRELSGRADGGGVLPDLGSHLVDQAVLLFGPVESVYAEEFSRRDGVLAGDDAFIALQHESGPVSHLWATATAALPAPRFRMLGSFGTYQKFGLDAQEARLREGVPASDPSWGIEPPSTWGTLSRGDTQETLPTVPGDWPMFYRSVADAIAFQTPLPVPVDSVLHTMAVLDAARVAAAERRVIRPRSR